MTKAEAKERGLKRYYTGHPCRAGHDEERLVSSGQCVVCNRLKVRRWKLANSGKRLAATYRWRKRNPNAHKSCVRRSGQKQKEKLEHRLRLNLRIRMWKAVKRGQKTGSAVRDLGCSIADFKTYMESLFQPGMTWDNMGDWHIDHKTPLVSFDLTDRNQFLKACHFTNLQPLWAEDNLSKGSS